MWKTLINRETDKKLWSPGSKSRVCSMHFQDSRFEYPTIDYRYMSGKDYT